MNILIKNIAGITPRQYEACQDKTFKYMEHAEKRCVELEQMGVNAFWRFESGKYSVFTMENKSITKPTKDQTEVPMKDQIIWVAQTPSYSKILEYCKRHFSHFENGCTVAFVDGMNSTQTDQVVYWDHYSLTDPSQP